ncbi:MAG: hypothetical protein ILM98_16355 [Kiritimatiellae bacterium]|nr:hypothetical protein [Kiritimatiellia bacterium]
MRRVLIVRLDAIGDYILWRNCLRFLRGSAKYRDAHITVLGNPAWRNIAETFDSDCANEWIWVENRKALFRKPIENLLPYGIWHRRVAREQAKLKERLKARGFDEVLSPCAYPDPLLDELVSGIAPETIAVENEDSSRAAAFSKLVGAGNEEFVFLKNRAVAANMAGEPCDVGFRLDLPVSPEKERRILFFTGASHWTKRWPKRNWRALSRMLPAGYKAAFAPMHGILADFTRLVASCAAVVTNDTMALHLAAALDVPAVALVNGATGRGGFWPYPQLLGKRVTVVGASCDSTSKSSASHGNSALSLASAQLAMWRNLAAVTPEMALAALAPFLNQDRPSC